MVLSSPQAAVPLRKSRGQRQGRERGIVVRVAASKDSKPPKPAAPSGSRLPEWAQGLSKIGSPGAVLLAGGMLLVRHVLANWRPSQS